MNSFYAKSSILLLLAAVACQPADPAGGSPASTAEADAAQASAPYLAGRIRVHGKLIEPPDGALHLVAKGEGMATPLVLKLPLSDGVEVKGQQALDLDFRLDKTSGMLGEMPRYALPEKLEFEISWTPDGFVPGIIDVHTLRRTVALGEQELDVQMFPGAVDPAAEEAEGERAWPRRAVAPPEGASPATGD